MRAPPLFARVVLALHSWQLLAAFEEITKKNVLRLKEERSDIDEKQNLPQMILSTVLDYSGAVCVRVRLRVEPLLANTSLQIESTELDARNSHAILVWRSHENSTVRWRRLPKGHNRRVKVDPCCFTNNEHLDLRKTLVWEMQFDCFKAQVDRAVRVSVHDVNRTLSEAFYAPTVHHSYLRDAVPRYDVREDTSAKLFTVNMDAGQELFARLCYKNLAPECKGNTSSRINTDLDPVVTFSIPHLVPCICVQLYYTGVDARRDTTCPFKDKRLPGGGDILSSSSLKLYGSSVLEWKPLCPSDPSTPAVSLCWQHHKNHSQCFPVQNSTLHDRDWKYNVTAVDKHAHMCVKFSLNDSQRVFCPFSSGVFSEWDVTVVTGSQRLHVRLSSSITASFSAQLCVEEEGEYVAKGNVHSVHMEEGTEEVELSLPLNFFIPALCVQVWRSEPFLHGKRIICPDYTHRRWGLVIAFSLAFLITLTAVGFLTYIFIKKKTSVWRCAERKPVLLVSSSDDAVHVAAVCALASGLQEELHTDVRLAQWAHCSTHASLAQLGPAPWLYGQCQEVQQAGGVVLLAWSLEAQQAFLQWRESGGKKERENSWWRGKISDEEKDTVWSNEQHKDKQKEGWMERASSVTDPVFNATLSSLWSGLHSERCGQGFGLVCFQDLGGSRHIPKELRGVRRYCLPRDLSSLIHELDLKESSPGGGDKKASRGWCCWPRFFSKALSFWLSHRLAQRLEAWLPQKKQDREKSKLILKLSHKPHGKLKKKKKKLKKKGEKKRKGPVTVHS
ncbi:interleukin-17 receptor C isoform X1 [Pygocentrus nattereri]|uniref:SEFIR domain-containing protein n=2 Tax=Pygocentrus nattereri TaxID=42514 RepID=A0A3B4DIM8_PYGNA|nr:interleukin-17 receptor C isoform X1 [Pygocentrus nattereri]